MCSTAGHRRRPRRRRSSRRRPRRGRLEERAFALFYLKTLRGARRYLALRTMSKEQEQEIETRKMKNGVGVVSRGGVLFRAGGLGQNLRSRMTESERVL